MENINTANLPEYICNMSHPYKPDPTHISTTDLVAPPLIRTLRIDHWDELISDVKDKFKMFHGIAWDEFCKKHCRWALTKIRIEIPLEGFLLVCKPDYYHVLDYVLADFKEKSIWNIKNFDSKNIFNAENIAQVNVYDWAMAWKTDLRIDKLQLHIYGRDWRFVEKLRYGREYPDIEFDVIDIDRWSNKEQGDYIDAQIKQYIKDPYRECTDKEKGKKPDTWAVKKKGNKTAQGGKVCNSETEAKQWIQAHPGKTWEIEFRKGECSRCEKYCQVAPYCKYFKKGK